MDYFYLDSLLLVLSWCGYSVLLGVVWCGYSVLLLCYWVMSWLLLGDVFGGFLCVIG